MNLSNDYQTIIIINYESIHNFSIPHLKSKLRMANEQMSVPLPAMPVKIPPKNPVNTKTAPCQMPKFWIES
jgi:hypothetical protein